LNESVWKYVVDHGSTNNYCDEFPIAMTLQATDAAGNVSQDVRVIRVTGDLKVK